MPIRIAALASRTEDVLQRLRGASVAIPAGSRLHRYLAALNAAAPLEYANPPEQLIRLCHRLLIEIDDLEQITGSLGSAQPVPGWGELVEQTLSGSPLRTEEANHSRARDVQFELLVAALFRRIGYSVSLEEPDVVAERNLHRIAIAAKRPRSRTKLRRNIHDAGKQILHLKLQGLIAIDTTVLMNPADQHLTTRDASVAYDAVTEQASNLSKYIASIAGLRFGTTKIFGVLARTAVPVWQPDTRILSFLNLWSVVGMIPPDDERRAIIEQISKNLSRIQRSGL